MVVIFMCHYHAMDFPILHNQMSSIILNCLLKLYKFVRCFFTAKRNILFERFKVVFLLVILTIWQGEKIFWCNANQVDQPIKANGAWSFRYLNTCYWMVISWCSLLIFISSWILIYKFSSNFFFSFWNWQGKKLFSTFFFFLWKWQGKTN